MSDNNNLARFLNRVNGMRGDLPPLTAHQFALLRERKQTLAESPWLPVFKKLVRCNSNTDNTKCYSTKKKDARFDESCRIKLQNAQPFATCMHEAEEKPTVELGDRQLVF